MRAILIASGLLAGMLTLHGCGGGDEEPTSIVGQTNVPTDATPKPATAAPTSPTDAPTDASSADARSTEACQVLEPTIPAYTPGVGQVPRILLGIAIWDPFVFIDDPPNTHNMLGLVPEFIEIMQNTCDDIDVQWVETSWGKCFEDPAAGEEIIYGAVHGCAGYTHLPGLRSRIFDWSHAITVPTANAAGIISRLNTDGTPVVSPMSDLSGVKVVDVKGYAPTEDLLELVKNECDGNKPMKDYILVDPGENGNAAAMAALRDGRADAMWVYSDQAYNCMKVCGDGGTNAPCPTTDDCYGWHGLGTDYAYIHTGVQYALNGTTLSISKKGSKVGELMNPCIAKALETKEYYDMCKKYHKENECFPNSHFTSADTALDRSVWDSPHNIRPLATGGSTCSGGYCRCDGAA